MQECPTSGSVREVPSDGHPYRNLIEALRDLGIAQLEKRGQASFFRLRRRLDETDNHVRR